MPRLMPTMAYLRTKFDSSSFNRSRDMKKTNVKIAVNLGWL